jgi:hypothetical protein
LKFALHNMQEIYNELMPDHKKRRYFFGVNKVFQVNIEEEDIRNLRDVAELAERKNQKPKVASTKPGSAGDVATAK